MLTKRRVILALSIIAVMAAILWLTNQLLFAGPRRQWKELAIAHIEMRLADHPWIVSESTRIKELAAPRPWSGQWVGDDILVTKNGEWIVCQNICNKENQRIKDIFIGRGSDGKWYYSTFHFCIGMCVLQMERQPDSLAQFVDGYWLVPFDGQSDECLKTTWTSGPWGDAKLQSEKGKP